MRVPARIGLAVGLFGLLLGCGADDSGAARRPDQGSTDASMADAAPDASSDPPGGPCARFGPGDSGEQGIGGGSSSLDDASTADTGPRAHAPFKDIDHACGPNGQCVQGPYCTPGGCVGESQYACVYEGNGTQHCWAQDGALVCGPNPPDGG